MSINVIAHNLPAMNTERTLGINTGSKIKAMEKLASGYRINRSADDAAGLAISEKMRRMIRGLNQGTQNAQDGASWVQIGDGSLDEAHSMLHRMTQLTVQSLNGTWTDSDRTAMQAEFEQLRKEIDRLTDATTFNENHIFAEHKIPYNQFEGNIRWMPNQKHLITEDTNTLDIVYRMKEGDPPQSVSIQVPVGQYTTKELMDEIDTALENAGLLDKGFRFEYTTQGTCNLNLEGGVSIDEAKGGLAYLLYDVYEGGSTGALIGTTRFESDDPDVTLKIVKGKNDEFSFDVVGLDGTITHVDMPAVPTDPNPLDPTATASRRYTRPELIDWLNETLKDLKVNGALHTTIEAVPYGQGIKLTSDDSIITALKGNMFKVDDRDKGEAIYTSIFYDNIGYGPATMLPAVLTGGAVLSTKVNDLEHGYFHIVKDSNDKLLVKPNGRDQAEELVIPEGYYNIGDMARELETLLAAKGLGSELGVTVSGDAARDDYQGLVVTSKVSGLESDVGIDKSSSAYDTLFVIRAYNKLEEHESYTRDPKSDVAPTYTGSKSFYAAGNWPFLVEAGVNDKFVMSVNDKKYEITLDTGGSGIAVYNSQTELIQAINGAIQKRKDAITDTAEKEQLGSVTASWSSSRVYLTSSDRRVDSISVSAASSGEKVNEGYADIFTTQASYQAKTANSTNGVVKLNQSIDVPVTIHDSEKTFVVTVDDNPYSMTLTPKTYNTYEEILEEINKNLPTAEVKDEPIVFGTVNKNGEDSTFKAGRTTGQITPPANPINLKGLGSSSDEQGEVKPGETDTAATITMNVPYFRNPPGITIDGNNGQLKINVNGVERQINVAPGTYTSISSLARNLQEKLDEDTAFGKGVDGVDVKASDNSIILTTRKKGDETGIICSSSDSKFIEHINTYIVAASMRLNAYTLSNFIKIDKGTNDTFKFKYNGAEYELTLSEGTYDRLGIQKEINIQLDKQNIPVRVKEDDGYYLTFTEMVPGNGNTLEFDSADGGTCVASLFGKNAASNQPATATLNKVIQETITIGANNTFQMTINGNPETITLTKGATYNSPEKFLEALNTALSGKGVMASLVGKQLKFTTTATGSNAGIYLKYDENSVLKDIFGTKINVYNGVEAEFDSASHKLVLKALGMDGNVNSMGRISVSSNTGSIFQKADKTITSTAPGTSTPGYHSQIYSSVNGAPLREMGGSTVTLNQWNNKLSFQYRYNGTYRNVNIELDIGSGTKVYSYDDLKTELENKLNAGLDADHPGRLNVEVSSDGVKIKVGTPGNSSYFNENSFSGGFYYNVLRRTAEKMQKTKPVITKGRNENATYAVGRKDLRNNTTLITKGVNDTLTLDFTYGDTVKKLSMTLDAGSYSGASMADHIQKKLNEQLVAEGLEPNLILAKIGGINTGVSGSNDNNSLIFSLANDVKLPSDDKDTVYTIDGIGGNAAFSVFYQTDGDIRIAYVTGTKDVSNGVTIPKDSKLFFDVDGEHYGITMPAGRYSQEQMLEELNKQLKAADAPVVAKVTDGGFLTITHSKYGKHQITNISGDAKRWLFFQENGEKEGNKDIWIRVGSESGDGVVIERPTMNTSFLGINSVTIEKPKYAEKALTRVKKAVTAVSSVRSYFGSMQNRLEHTIDQNNNTAENMQAAESVIRDTDMARETLNMSRAGILENVGHSLLAQANRARQDVLALLQ